MGLVLLAIGAGWLQKLAEVIRDDMGAEGHLIFAVMIAYTGLPMGYGWSFFIVMLGYTYGWVGVLTANVATALGHALGFWSSRYCFRKSVVAKVETLPPHWREWIDLVQDGVAKPSGGVVVGVLVRCGPPLTFGMCNAFDAALTPMAFYTSAIGSVISQQHVICAAIYMGILLREIETAGGGESGSGESGSGDDGSAKRRQQAIQAVLLGVQFGVALLLMALISWWARRVLQHRMRESRLSRQSNLPRDDVECAADGQPSTVSATSPPPSAPASSASAACGDAACAGVPPSLPANMSTAVTFESHDARFDALHDGAAYLLASSTEPLFHEGGVWMAATREWLVTSDRLLQGTERTHVRISAIAYPSGDVRQLPHLEKVIRMANGGTSDAAGGAYLCCQGFGAQSGSLWHLDAALRTATRVGPPPELTLNSLNDCVVHRRSGTVLFTDPTFGFEAQNFRTASGERKGVWAVHPQRASAAADWRVLADGIRQPNGLLLSPNERVAYVTDVWSDAWASNDRTVPGLISSCLGKKREEAPAPAAAQLARTETGGGESARILAYNVTHAADGTITLSDERLFVDLRAEGARGFPDGVKCDEAGNVYAGCGGGVRVYAPDATFLGMMAVEGGVANLCFGGEEGNVLLLLNETRAFAVRMRCRGALVGAIA